MTSVILETAAKPVGLAIVCSSIPPYRAHLHRKLALGLLPGVRLYTLQTHDEEARWDPAAVPPEANVTSVSDGTPVSEHGSMRHFLSDWRVAGRVIHFIRHHDIRAVILLGYNDIGKVRLIRWCRSHRVPCFVWGDSNIRDERLTRTKALLKSIIVGSLLRWVSGVMPVGSLGEAFFEKYGVLRNRMYILSLEPDYELIQTLDAATIQSVRTRHQLSAQRRHLIFSGRLIECKRVDQLIDAFCSIAAERPNWDLLVVGDGALRSQLETRVPLPLKDRVHWLGHFKDPADVAAFYRLADALVLPSTNDRWALVINEAVAAGLAVVSSSVPGATAELVRDGFNGKVYPAGDLSALIRALTDVTDEANIDRYKANSPAMHQQWIDRADPVANVRRALQEAGVPTDVSAHSSPSVSTIAAAPIAPGPHATLL